MSNVIYSVSYKQTSYIYILGFINIMIFSRRGTSFRSRQDLLNWTCLEEKNVPSDGQARWEKSYSKQVSLLKASQFAQCPSLNVTPVHILDLQNIDSKKTVLYMYYKIQQNIVFIW